MHLLSFNILLDLAPGGPEGNGQPPKVTERIALSLPGRKIRIINAVGLLKQGFF